MTTVLKRKTDLFNRLFSIENNWGNVLYIHTPFCPQKCFYCVYGSKVPSGKDEMEEFYNKIFPQQIMQYEITLNQVKFDHIHFGGGTPTIIEAEALEKHFNRIPGFKQIPLKTIEVSPFTITDEHMDLLRNYGFTYVSIGVQTLSTPILNLQNRALVEKEKIRQICEKLHQCNIISNLDLIFFLETGDISDLSRSKQDLGQVMSEIRPISVTIHSNYKVKKSLAKQRAMIELIKEMISKYPEYLCVNSLLEESDLESDMVQGAEFRLMRKHRDFNFYMIGKIPGAFTFGLNMLSLGEYLKFKPRSNYFYISDFLDKYVWLEKLKKYQAIYIELNEIRKKLGLAYKDYRDQCDFFQQDTAKEKFKGVLEANGLPYYDFKRN